MRFTQLLAKTWKENVKDAELVSHNYLIRAGYVRQLAAGIFSYLHLGNRSLKKIEQVLREELDRIGGVEIVMPVVHPAEIWKKTNRWYEIDKSMARFQDRNDRDMVLAMTHEEVVADLCRTEISSYKQLPKLVYQIYTKFRDEARSRGGLIRVREFTMKDSYSLDSSWEGLEKQYIHHYDAYYRIAARTGLPLVAVLSDTGMMGGRVAHEFMYLTDVGEDTIYKCSNCDYVANKEVARFKKEAVKEAEKPLEKVHTPGAKTVEDLTNLFKLGKDHFAKINFLHAKIGGEDKMVLALIPGDLELNFPKLQKTVKATELNAAREDAIRAIKAEPGFGSPIGVDRKDVIIVIDELIAEKSNWITGANEVDYHVKNACYPRDFEADIVTDIVSAYEGAVCPECEKGTLDSVRGVEVGNIFQLGTKYSAGLEARFTDDHGKAQDIIMGSYGIGVGRILACAIEEHHDDRGICLPISIAPYQVMLVALIEGEEVEPLAEQLYADMKARGIEVLFDNRDSKLASPGMKFGDADLIGLPIRVTVSKRALKNGGVELKLRSSKDFEIIAPDQIIDRVQKEIAQMFDKINMEVESAPRWS